LRVAAFATWRTEDPRGASDLAGSGSRQGDLQGLGGADQDEGGDFAREDATGAADAVDRGRQGAVIRRAVAELTV
jgi:hypothetical protein